MRFFWICVVSLGLFAQTQKTQIMQTYTYQITQGDIKQENKNQLIQLKILSKELLDFINANQLEGRLERQVVKFHDAYTEFTASSQSIHSYSNSANTKLRFNFRQMIYDLEYVGEATYTVKNAISPIKNLTNCDIVIQKTLSSSNDAKKDFVINLDNQYHFGQVLATYKYLRCAKD